MSQTIPFLLMDEAQAARFRDETAGAPAALDPILVRGGQYLGSYVLPERVETSPDFAQYHDDFARLDVVHLVCSEAFPPIDEDDDQA